MLQVVVLMGAWLRTPGGPVDLPLDLIAPRILVTLAWGVGFAVLSLVVVWRVGHKHEALIAALFLAVYALWTGLARQPLLAGAAWLGPVLVLVDALAHAIGIRFTQLFPRPLTFDDVAGLGRGRLTGSLSSLLAVLTRPRVFWTFAVVLEVFGRSGVVPRAYQVHVVVWLLLAVSYLYASYRRGGREERQRTFWILEGVAVFLAVEVVWLALVSMSSLGIVSFDLVPWARWQMVVEAWATLVCFALAIFYSGALDSGLVLRRTTVLSAAGALVLVLFIALETTVGELAVDMLGLDTRIADIGIGVIAALAFHPVSRRIDAVVGRWTGSGERANELGTSA